MWDNISAATTGIPSEEIQTDYLPVNQLWRSLRPATAETKLDVF